MLKIIKSKKQVAGVLIGSYLSGQFWFIFVKKKKKKDKIYVYIYRLKSKKLIFAQLRSEDSLQIFGTILLENYKSRSSACMDKQLTLRCYFLHYTAKIKGTGSQSLTLWRASLMAKVDPRGCGVDAGQRQQGETGVISHQQVLKNAKFKG